MGKALPSTLPAPASSRGNTGDATGKKMLQEVPGIFTARLSFFSNPWISAGGCKPPLGYIQRWEIKTNICASPPTCTFPLIPWDESYHRCNPDTRQVGSQQALRGPLQALGRRKILPATPYDNKYLNNVIINR